MRALLLISLAALAGGALAQTPVSGYRFNGTLAPYIDNNAPHVKPLEMRRGGGNGMVIQPTFVTDMVGPRMKQVALVTDPEYFRAWHGMNKNGGGDFTNLYTIVMDIKVENARVGEFHSLYNTNADNSNDGDSFIRWDNVNNAPVGRLGELGDYGGNFPRDTWVRLAWSVDCTTSFGFSTDKVYYVNGVRQHDINFPPGRDGVWALFNHQDGEAPDHVNILADNDGENMTGKISLLLFYDRVLSGSEVAALGGPGTPVFEPTREIVAPSEFRVQFGRLDSGDVASLAAEDGNVLRICKFIVPNQSVSPVTVTVDGTTQISPVNRLKLIARSRMTLGGIYNQTLEMFDWTTNAFDPIDKRTDPITRTATTRELDATGNAGRFVDANGRMRMRYSIKPDGPTAGVAWCTEHDFVNWSINP